MLKGRDAASRPFERPDADPALGSGELARLEQLGDERGDRRALGPHSVTWPNRSWPLSVSITDATPSWRPTRRLSR